MAGSKSIVIIGGGVIGLCSAHYARERGYDVTVVERESRCHEGCSAGNAGMVVPSHIIPLAAPGMISMGLRMMFRPESPFYIRPRCNRDLLRWGWHFIRSANRVHVRKCAPLLRDLALESRRGFEELARLGQNEFGLKKNGLLMLCGSRKTLDAEARVAALARGLGLEARVLSSQETARLEPEVAASIAGSVHYTQDCYLVPQKFIAGLTAHLQARQVRFEWCRTAIEWGTSGRRIRSVNTDQGPLTADEFVVAAGSWSPGLLRALGVDLPMQAGKGYSLTLEQPKSLPRRGLILVEARVAVTPMQGLLRFGGTMEIAGLDRSINPRRVRGIVRSIPSYLPDFTEDQFKGIVPWSGLRPCSPDGMPYIGRTGRFANLIIATGHAMLGLSLGPVTGKIVSMILAGETPPVALGLLDPDRFNRLRWAA